MATTEEHILLLTDRFTKTMNDAKGATESMNSAFGGLGSLIAEIGVGIGIASLTKSVLNLGIEAEQTQTSFAVMTGSVANANKLLGDLAQFANVTPFDNKAVEDSAKILLQFGIKGENVVDTLRMLGDTSGGNAERLNAMSMAFGKMSSSGRLTGEVVDTMITNGFNPLSVMAEQMSKTLGISATDAMSRLRKQMEQGKISVEQTVGAFKTATSEGGMFFGMMDKQSATVGGRLSTLQGTIYEIGKSIGLALNPVVGALIDNLQGMAEFIVKNKDVILTLTGAIAGAVAGYKFYMIWTNLSAIATGGLSLAIQAMNFVMSMNPIGIMIGLFAGLVAGLVVAYNKFDAFRALIDGVWASMKQLSANAIKTFTSLPETIIGAFQQIPKAIGNVMSGVGKLLTAIVTGDFKSVPALLKNIGGDLLKTNPLITVAKTIGGNLSDGVAEAFANGKSASMKLSSLKAGQKAVDPALTGGVAGSGLSVAGATTGSSKGIGSGLSEITAGAPKVFNINIEKLVETLSFNTNNISESKNVIRDEISKILLTAVNDAQIISTQQ